MTGFALYKRETSTLPFKDYGLIIEEVRSADARTALEFGPGYSTLALIESGLKRIVTCEHDAKWRKRALEMFAKHPQVEVISYRNAPEAVADELCGVFDIAFVDSPKGYHPARVAHPGQEDCSRLNTCLLALKHAPVVLLHDAYRPLERGTLARLSGVGHDITMLECNMARIERNAQNTQ